MAARTRPMGVTIVAIIVLVSGVIGTIGAVISIASGTIVAGTISLILGILTLLVGAGLFARSQIARILTTIVLVLQLAYSIFTLGSTGFATAAVVWPLLSGVLAIVGIVLLFTKQANAYFR